jgi:hypothetical protein
VPPDKVSALVLVISYKPMVQPMCDDDTACLDSNKKQKTNTSSADHAEVAAAPDAMSLVAWNCHGLTLDAATMEELRWLVKIFSTPNALHV